MLLYVNICKYVVIVGNDFKYVLIIGNDCKYVVIIWKSSSTYKNIIDNEL